MNFKRAIAPAILSLRMLLLAPLAALHAADAPTTKPNILFIVADDLDTRLGCYGDPMARTPHMDQLAAGGVRFDRAYCQLPSCGPSRVSMLTGLYPWQTGLVRNDEAFRKKLPEIVTLPQWLRQHGYFSARVGKIYHMGIPGDIGRAGDDDPKSWDLAINNTGWDVRPDTEAAIHRTAPEGGLGVTPSWLAGEAPEEEFSDAVGTREAVRIMREQHPARTGKPLFLAMGCDILGLKMPHASPGQSLRAQLLDVTAPAAKTTAVTFVRQGSYSLRTERYRYTEWKGGAAGIELYDHRTDPHEWRNLARVDDQQAIVAELSHLLRQASGGNLSREEFVNPSTK